MIVYVKPGCSTCREALSMLDGISCEYETRDYLTDPPSKKELKALLKKLHCKAIDLVRKKESLFKEKYEGRDLTESEWLDVLTKNPILIERPILISDVEAVIGRPPSLVVDLAKKVNKK